MAQQYFSADEAIALLGISKSTLYSYVSRGLIRSEEARGKTRARRYVAADVRGLQQRKEQRRNPAKSAAVALHFGDPVLESAITLIDGGRLYYRGHDALALAQRLHFETVAALLWSGKEDGSEEQRDGTSDDGISAMAPALRETVHALVAQGHVANAMQMALLAGAPTDLAAYNQTEDAVAKTGLRILNRLTDVVTATPEALVARDANDKAMQTTGEQATRPSIAQRLQESWVPEQSRMTELLDTALILCADHELNASSFTARCVASTGATPYAAVVAALAALQGYKHGGSTRDVLAFLLAATNNPEKATQERLQSGRGLPGFGHLLYPNGDPRGRLLLDLAQDHYPQVQIRITADRIIDIARRAVQLEPNLDFGLTVLAQSAGLPSYAPFSLFALGRTAGWIGHIMEQYGLDRLIRPRARYTGRTIDSVDR